MALCLAEVEPSKKKKKTETANLVLKSFDSLVVMLKRLLGRLLCTCAFLGLNN